MQEENIEFKNIFESVTDPESAKIMKSLSDKLIKAREELETLRASNTIKQANIELLEAENAKLIAERDELREQLSVVRNSFEGISWPYHYCYELLKYAGIDFSGSAGESIVYAVKRLLAEREAMMKPKHKRADELVIGDSIKKNGEFCKIFQITNLGGYIKINFDETHLPPEALIEMIYGPLPYGPLPAQQIPEGYALVPIEPTEEMRDAANRVDELASEKEILSSDHFINIYKAMLSASQTKGES